MIKKEKPLEGLTKIELYRKLAVVSSPKEAREIHRALKKYGDSVPFTTRYPNFHFAMSAIAFIVSIATFIKEVIG